MDLDPGVTVTVMEDPPPGPIILIAVTFLLPSPLHPRPPLCQCLMSLPQITPGLVTVKCCLSAHQGLPEQEDEVEEEE